MNQVLNNKNFQKTYDLEERTAKFGEKVIGLIKQIKINQLNQNIISQLMRSALSIGANYCEANASSSRKDFRKM